MTTSGWVLSMSCSWVDSPPNVWLGDGESGGDLLRGLMGSIISKRFGGVVGGVMGSSEGRLSVSSKKSVKDSVGCVGLEGPASARSLGSIWGQFGLGAKGTPDGPTRGLDVVVLRSVEAGEGTSGKPVPAGSSLLVGALS